MNTRDRIQTLSLLVNTLSTIGGTQINRKALIKAYLKAGVPKRCFKKEIKPMKKRKIKQTLFSALKKLVQVVTTGVVVGDANLKVVVRKDGVSFRVKREF